MHHCLLVSMVFNEKKFPVIFIEVPPLYLTCTPLTIFSFYHWFKAIWLRCVLVWFSSRSLPLEFTDPLGSSDLKKSCPSCLQMTEWWWKHKNIFQHLSLLTLIASPLRTPIICMSGCRKEPSLWKLCPLFFFQSCFIQSSLG